MILYTPMQLELVLAGLEQMKHESIKKTTIDGVPALVRDVGCDKKELVQVLSTKPADFLRGDLYPGAIVRPDY